MEEFISLTELETVLDSVKEYFEAKTSASEERVGTIETQLNTVKDQISKLNNWQ